MPTINEILNGLGVPEDTAEKTASVKSTTESSIEKQARELGLIDDNADQGTTKTASTNQEKSMNLKDLYDMSFGAEKTAAEIESAEYESEEKVANDLEAAGEMAGVHFAQGLGERLFTHAVKIAMDGSPESAATQARSSSGNAVPGASTGDVHLPVNRPADADKPMDTKPMRIEAMSEFDKAVAKAKIESALASGNPGELSHKSHNVDTGLETPSTQKTASLKNLSREELIIYNMKFAPEMMKQAHAVVAEESVKVAELQKTANECYNYGIELAMQKIAEMEEKAKEEKEEKKEEGEEEKTASAMGSFILEGYWNTLMEKGAEFYGDENVYVEELLKEAGLDKVAATAKASLASKAKGLGSEAIAKGKKAFGNLKAKGQAAVKKSEDFIKKHPKSMVAGATAAGLGAGALIDD